MSWQDVLQERQFDIGLTAVSTVIGIVAPMIIDALRNGSSTTPHGSAPRIHVSFTTIKQAAPRLAPRGTSDDQTVFGMVAFAALAAAIFYFFFKSEILSALKYLALCILGGWAGVICYSFAKGVLVGIEWIFGFLMSLLFCFFFVVVADKAITPDVFPPQNFPYVQQLINEFGVTGMTSYFSAADFRWLALHFLGVVCLFAAQLRMIFSVVYFAAMTLYVSGTQRDWILRLIKRTTNYQRVYRNIIAISILLFFSQSLVSGEFFAWFEYKSHAQINELMHRVFNGRH